MSSRAQAPQDPDQLLDAPAALSARQLCLRFVADVQAAIGSLGDAGDAGIASRHDVRVALRRLHVTLVAYADTLEDTVSGKLAKRVRKIARRLNALREHDVFSALLTSAAAARPARERKPLHALATAPAPHGTGDAAAATQQWSRLSGDVRAALEQWTVTERVDGRPIPATFASVAARALLRATRRAAQRCTAVTGITDHDGMHKARLALKTARYLLAPLAGTTPDGPAMVKALRAAQDHFGAIRDAEQLLARIHAAVTHESTASGRRPPVHRSLDAVTADLNARIATEYEALAPWLDASAREGFVARLRAIAESWQSRTTPHMEIERKWLLSALPPRVKGLPASTLRQGYLPGVTLIERIRSVTRGGETRWVRTVKLGRGLSRIEIEEEAPPALGEALFALTEGKRVEKLRYAVDDGAFTWEIDDFTDRDLVLAECELPDEATSVTPPPWLAPYIVRDVTDEPTFTNWMLAR